MSKGSESASGFDNFDRVKSPEEQAKFLVQSAKLLSTSLVWTANQDYVIPTHMVEAKPDRNTMLFWASTEFNYEAIKAHLLHKREAECFFKVAHPMGALFFNAEYESLDIQGLRFRFPKEVFRVQRRQSARYTVREAYTIKVDMQDPLAPSKIITRKMFDLSSSGISFVVAQEDEPIFPKGMMLKDIQFKINNSSILVDGEVRHTQQITDSLKRKMVKVGVKFIQLSAEHDRLITLYVFEESRKFLVWTS